MYTKIIVILSCLTDLLIKKEIYILFIFLNNLVLIHVASNREPGKHVERISVAH